MDLFDPGVDDDREFAELTKPAETTQEGQSPPQVIGAIIGAVVLVILLVLLGRWIYHVANNPSTQNTSGTGQITVQSPLKTNNKTGSNAPSGSPAPSSSSSTSSSSTSNITPKNTTVSGTLPNNGPGNVVAIFAGSSLAAAGLHYIVTVRRSTKSSA